MIDAIVIWDLKDDPQGNVLHIAEHGISMDEVEQVLLNEQNPVVFSRSSGRPITFGRTQLGRSLAVVWETALDDPLMLRPITAYEIE